MSYTTQRWSDCSRFTSLPVIVPPSEPLAATVNDNNGVASPADRAE
jgi:hypothetical protein